jgi:hypothetical protein
LEVIKKPGVRGEASLLFSLSDACPDLSGLEERGGERRPFISIAPANITASP